MKRKDIERLMQEANKAKAKGNIETYQKIYCFLGAMVKYHGAHAQEIKAIVKTFSPEVQAKYKHIPRKKIKSVMPHSNPPLYEADELQGIELENESPVEINEISNCEQPKQEKTEIKLNSEQQSQEKTEVKSDKEMLALKANLQYFKEQGLKNVMFMPGPATAEGKEKFEAVISECNGQVLKSVREIMATRNLVMITLYFLTKERHAYNMVDEKGCAPIHHLYFSFASLKELMPIFKFLQQNGADINARDKNGLTLLHMLVNFQPETPAMQEEVNLAIAFLLQEGCNPNIAHNNGITPLITAACRGNLLVAALLTEAGATTDYKGIMGGAFNAVASNNNIAALNCLLQANAGTFINVKLDKVMLEALDAKTGIVHGFINDQFTGDLKAEGKCPGLKKAITTQEEVLTAFLDGTISKTVYNAYLRNTAKISYPNANDEFIEKQIQSIHDSLQKMETFKANTRRLNEMLNNPKPGGLNPSDPEFQATFKAVIQAAQEARKHSDPNKTRSQEEQNEKQQASVRFSIPSNAGSRSDRLDPAKATLKVKN